MKPVVVSQQQSDLGGLKILPACVSVAAGTRTQGTIRHLTGFLAGTQRVQLQERWAPMGSQGWADMRSRLTS
jgi:hypothetical protein